MRANNDYDRAKRDLLRRIRRNRRQIDGRFHAIHRRSLQWMFWGQCARWAWRELRGIWTESAVGSKTTQPGEHRGRT